MPALWTKAREASYANEKKLRLLENRAALLKSENIRPESWRDDLLALVLRVGFWVGLITYLPSAWAAVHFDELAVLVVDTLAITLLAYISFSRRLAQTTRAVLFCSVMYSLGCLLLLRVGAIGQIYLFAASLFATLLLGKRAGLISVGVNLVSMLGLGYLSFVSPDFNSTGTSIALGSWTIQSLNFAFVNLIVTLAVAAVIQAVEAALAKALRAQKQLKVESAQLLDANRSLQEKEEILETAGKMDAVGRLAGGVAHDFNNMLNVILGQTELAMLSLPDDSPLRTEMEQIIEAAERSAGLTRQLLTFARKQTISPRSIELNGRIQKMMSLLRRLIGEDIDLSFEPGEEVGTTCMDPNQLDQILANLAVNARDAIEGHGQVTVSTYLQTISTPVEAAVKSLAPGDYIVLCVTDDGHGMDEETRARLFEPFFTTKAVGVGTGLGLSTVYGIVRQNEGAIFVRSSPGEGSTFEIYLRRTGVKESEPEEQEEQLLPLGEGERILLVEDEEAVLTLGTAMLTRLGYDVVAISDPRRALELAAQGEKFALLVTDVIMPQLSGREVYQGYAEHQDGLKCLYVSGYTADIIAESGVLAEGTHFLQKPFSMEGLARKVRSILDAS